MGIFKKIKKDFLWIIAIILLTTPVYSKLVRPGFFPMQDDLQAFRVYEMDKCFSDLQIPCRWVPDAGYQYGYPQFNYYPPSVYYLGAILHRIGIEYIDTVKILFILGYIASALTMFLLVRELWGGWPGVVASLLYTYVPYKAVEVYVRGALSEFWSLAIFPLIFWASYLLIKTSKKKYFIWLAVSASLLAITHNLMTLIFAPVAIIWVLYWIWAEKKWHRLLPIALSALLGIGLAAFYFLPVLFERKYIHVESLLSGYFDYRQHFVSLSKLFFSREWGYGSSGFPNEVLNLSTGLVQWLIGLLAVGLGIVNLRKNKKFGSLVLILGAVELMVLFMIHMKSSFIWARLPILWWLQFPWRLLSVSIFLLSLLAGLAVSLSGRGKYILGAIAIGAAMILNIGFFIPKAWLNISDRDKFSGASWEKQLTISIFDYLPIYAKLPPWAKAPDYPEVLEGKADFISYYKGSNYQKGEVEVTKEALIRLPLFDFPGMKVLVDGEKVDYRNDDCRNERYCLGLITFRLAAGRHQFSVRLTDTPIRKMANLMTLFSLGIVVYIGVKSKKK